MQLKVSFPFCRVGGSQTALKLFTILSVKAKEAKFGGKLLIWWSSKKKKASLSLNLYFIYIEVMLGMLWLLYI